MGVCNCSVFWCTLLYVRSSIAIILMGKRELIALLNLSSWCLVMVERLFLAVPWGCLQFVIVVFPDHTHLLLLVWMLCLMNFNDLLVFIVIWLMCFAHNKVIRLQRSGIDTIKYHTWPRIPMGKWQTHRRHHKREPRGQPLPSRWPQSTYKQTRTKHSKHKTEQKHKRSTKEVPPWNGQ